MEKRSFDDRTSKWVDEKVVKDEPIVTPKIEEPKTSLARIVLQHNIGTLIVQGAVSGNVYRFYGAGYSLEVDTRDLPELLARKRGGCCGSEANPYFSLV